MAKKIGGKSVPALAKWIEDLAARVKEGVEVKDWAGVDEACAVESVWAFDRPLARRDWIAALRSALADARDIGVSFLEPARSEASSGRAHLALKTQVVWTSAKDGSEKESTFTLSLGASSRAGRPVLDYVGLAPVMPAAHGGREPLQGGFNPFRTPQYFTQASSGFHAMAGFEAAPKGEGRYMMIYMPVFVPADAFSQNTK